MTCRKFTKYILFLYLAIVLTNCKNQNKENSASLIIAETLELPLDENWMILEKEERLKKGDYSWLETRLYLKESIADKFSMTIRVLESNNETTRKRHQDWFKPESPMMNLCQDQNERIYCEESKVKVLSQNPLLTHFFQKDWIIPYKNKQIHINVGAFTKVDFEQGLNVSESTIQSLINHS